MKKTLKNILWGFTGQLVSILISVILPRLIIISFGSEVNGITSAITQVFVYLGLMEAGIGSAALTRLYKNISDENQSEISRTVSATRSYYAALLPAYILGVIVFALLYPKVIDSTVPAGIVRMMILIQGACGTINFLFTNAYLQLLTADGRNYVASILTLLLKIVSISGQVLLIHVGANIAVVQLAILAGHILQAVIIKIYIQKQYPWLQLSRKSDISILEQRRSFVVHEISSVIFQSTDLFLISLLCSLTEASIYSVYSMIYMALSNLMSIFMRSIDFRLGNEYHKDMYRYIQLHDFYETIYINVVFAIISAAYIVTLPFIKLYTVGINDANYIYPLFPLLFALIQLLSCSRAICSKLIAISGNARDTIPNTILESVINLVSSIVLIRSLGMIGALMGTILALLYRTNDIIIYANKKILKRSPAPTYRTFFVNSILFAVTVILVAVRPVQIDNYLSFFLKGVFILVGTLSAYSGVHVIINKQFRKRITRILRSLAL